MNRPAIYHRSMAPWCFPVNDKTLAFRVQTAVNDLSAVEIFIGDPFDWVMRETAQERHWNTEKHPLVKVASDGIHDWWEVQWKPPYRRARYHFRLHTAGGSWDLGEKGLFAVESPASPPDFWNSYLFAYLHPHEVLSPPSWVERTVWYQIFPDRFFRSPSYKSPSELPLLPWKTGPVSNQEFYGGNLAGITEKLAYLQDLGFSGIYLTPIFLAPSVHKYDTEDYNVVDPGFGTRQDLANLVQACHDHGIRIILDAVFNHCGRRFGPWLDVVEKGPHSRYSSWFHIDSFPLFPTGPDRGNRREAAFETFSFTTNMPKLNTANPEVRDYLLDSAERWTHETQLDGWRLDVANEVDHTFWKEFRQRIKRVNPEAYIVGEVWHDSLAWLSGDQFDAVMNYPYGFAVHDFLSRSPAIPDGIHLAQRLTTLDMAYPSPAVRAHFNLLDSHDTERLITRLQGDKALARLGWFLLALLPGSPCFYYGSEVGLQGGGDPDNRRCMPWSATDQDLQLTQFFRSLLRLHRTHGQVWRDGAKTFISDSRVPGLFGWKIRHNNTDYLMLVNRDSTPISARTLRSITGQGQTWKNLWEESRPVAELEDLGGKDFLAVEAT